MTEAHKMQNALRIMMSLDEVRNIIGTDGAAAFHRDPLAAAIRMDETTWAKVFELITARQPKGKTT